MLCLHKATLSIVGRFHRIFLTSIHSTPFMVMELILLRKFEKCQEIFGWLQYMPFCSICAVITALVWVLTVVVRYAPILPDPSWLKYQCTSNLQDIMKYSFFDNFGNFVVLGQYFTILWEVIVRKTWFELALHQNKPHAANFGRKRGICNEFGGLVQLLFFWSNSIGLFWPFFGGSKHPKYQNMNDAIINHCWATISVQSYQIS